MRFETVNGECFTIIFFFSLFSIFVHFWIGKCSSCFRCFGFASCHLNEFYLIFYLLSLLNSFLNFFEFCLGFASWFYQYRLFRTWLVEWKYDTNAKEMCIVLYLRIFEIWMVFIKVGLIFASDFFLDAIRFIVFIRSFQRLILFVFNKLNLLFSIHDPYFNFVSVWSVQLLSKRWSHFHLFKFAYDFLLPLMQWYIYNRCWYHLVLEMAGGASVRETVA